MLVLRILLLLPMMAQSQLFDMTDGNEEGLVYPCENGPIGMWELEDVNLYPGGPTDGLVLASAIDSASCLETPDAVEITQESKFTIKVYVPYTESYFELQVWLIDVSKPEHLQYRWFFVTGPITPGNEWMEFSTPLPPEIVNGPYKISIWDTAHNQGIAIRYFQISNFEVTTTPVPTTTTTTTEITTTETTTENIPTTVETITTSSTIETMTTSPSETTKPSTTEVTPTETTTKAVTSTSSTESSSTVKLTTKKDTTTASPSIPTTSAPPSNFQLNPYGLIIGIIIGAALMSLVFCCWWYLIAAWLRVDPPEANTIAPIPRLEVVSSSPSNSTNSRITIRGKLTSSNWSTMY